MPDCANATNTSLPKLYSPAQIAERLGVTVRTVHNWIHDGILAYTRLAGQRLIRVSEQDLLAFLNEGYQPAQATIQRDEESP